MSNSQTALQAASKASSLPPLRGISSMATKQVLASLCSIYAAQTGQLVEIESLGGVNAAKRVQNASSSGESFDLVLLASDAIDRLVASSHVSASSKVDWVNSPVAVAVPAGQQAPDISSEAALKAAVAAAQRISYSTGPSGNYLRQLFESWGMSAALESKLLVPPPGVSVGSLLATRQADLGFQQLSELLFVSGLQIIGQLPTEIAYITTFSGGIPSTLHHKEEAASRVEAAQAFLNFLASSAAEPSKSEQGMYWQSASVH
jgi:molybdate transport system substrate-binding protein